MIAAAMNGTMLASGETASLLQAFEEGSLGVSFGIAGFLVGYLAGVAYLLAELGIITPMTKVAGASSGALLSMGLCSGITDDKFQQILQDLCNGCRKRGNCQGALGPAVSAAIANILPPDAYKRCSDRAYMSITIGPFPGKGLTRNLLVSEFTNNADLTAAGHASSYIPLWSGKTPTTVFRSMSAYDGFFTNSQPCPPGIKACIKINSKNPPWNNQNLDEFFHIFSRVAHAGPLRPARLASLAASITGAVTTESSAAAGTGGASSPQQQQQQQQSQASHIAQAMQKAASMGVDIAPGIYGPTGVAPEVWEELIVMPGDDAINKYLWHLGRRDAQIWARATGLEAAAAAKRATQRSNLVYVQG